MDHGDSCNTLEVQLSNHLGTHVDCPYHFDPAGARVTDYPPEFWQLSSVGVVCVQAQPGHLISEQDLMSAPGCDDLRSSCEGLFIKTGWSKHRSERAYWESPPGYSPSLASWLRERLPKLRFFGFDTISLSSFLHRETGREAHRAFLKNPHPILILEDMDLSKLQAPITLGEVLISPLFLSDADGAPCTVWAKP